MTRLSRWVLFICPAAVAVAMVVPASASIAVAAKAATTTTVAASVTSSSYDSPVTITAHVTSAAGTPTGSVTLADASNGSILATPALSGGTVTFTTAALAPGTRKIMARYNGSTHFARSSSAGLSIPVTLADDGVATAYQIDPGHDGFQARGWPNPTTLFFQKWNVALGGDTEVSYPLIAGGRVFVTVSQLLPYGSNCCGTVMKALDAATGRTDWFAYVKGVMSHATLAYDGQRVFALNPDGTLTAYAAATGRVIWSKRLTGQISFIAPPTAYDGIIYVSGAGNGGTLYAVSEASGAVRWTAPVENGDGSSPAVDNSGVYLSFACHQDYRFNLRGRLVWHKDAFCQGLRGSTPALHGNRVYMRGDRDYPLIFSKSSGTDVGSFVSDTPPAFYSDMYLLQHGKLAAASQISGGTSGRWTFGDGTLILPPVAAGGYVYAASRAGNVYAVETFSGQQVWTVNLGATVIGGPETGMAIGGGLLVVPTGSTLTAFG
jgi:outer membrane protein assembly factor BamB